MGRKSREKRDRTPKSINVKTLREHKVLPNMLYCPLCRAQSYPFVKLVPAGEGKPERRIICASCRKDVTDVLRNLEKLQQQMAEGVPQVQEKPPEPNIIDVAAERIETAATLPM